MHHGRQDIDLATINITDLSGTGTRIMDDERNTLHHGIVIGTPQIRIGSDERRQRFVAGTGNTEVVAVQYEKRIIIKACVLHILEKFSQGFIGIMSSIEITVNRFVTGIQSEGVIHLVFREREVIRNGYELCIERLR